MRRRCGVSEDRALLLADGLFEDLLGAYRFRELLAELGVVLVEDVIGETTLCGVAETTRTGASAGGLLTSRRSCGGRYRAPLRPERAPDR
jgi:hypothetical protein